jgi:hypothetical protein
VIATNGQRNLLAPEMNCQSKAREVTHSQLCVKGKRVCVWMIAIDAHMYKPSKTCMNFPNAAGG